MKYLKLFEQFDEWDPFGEEILHRNDDIREGDIVILIDNNGIDLNPNLNYPKFNKKYIATEIGSLFLKVNGANGVWQKRRFKKI